MEKDLKTIADHYGQETQSRQLVEEMAELTQAMCKFQRAKDGHEKIKAFVNVIEEIADVEIMLDQIKYLENIHERVDMIKTYKVWRQIARIREGQ